MRKREFTKTEKDLLNELIKGNHIHTKAIIEKYQNYRNTIIRIELKDGKVFDFLPENYDDILSELNIIIMYNNLCEKIK